MENERELRKRGLLCLGQLLKNDRDLIRIEDCVFRNSSTESEYLQNILLSSGDVLSGNFFPSGFDFCHPIWDEEKRREESRQKLFQHLETCGKKSCSETMQCKKCKESSIVSCVVAQTRRGDEGMTTFLSCSKCGSRWVSTT